MQGIMTIRSLPFMIAGAVILSCSETSDGPSDLVVRSDSSGVEIVAHGASPDDAPTEVDAEPILVIDSEGNGSGLALFQITALVPLNGGRLAVGASGSRSVYVFDEDGQLEHTLGGPGEGPGEFETIRGVVAIAADSVVVLDNRLGRLTVFTPSGYLARTIDVARFLPPQRGASLHIAADGFWLVGIATLAGGKSQGVNRHAAETYRLSAVGDSLATYGPYSGAEVFLSQRLSGGLPFGATLVSGARGGRLILGQESAPELMEVTTTGQLARIVRWPDRDREVSPERARAYAEFQVDALPEAAREQLGSVLRDLPYAPVAPAYHNLVVASDGTVWLGDYPGPEAFHPAAMSPAREWTLIDPDGVRRRVVRTPPGFTVMAVDGGRIYGVYRDELGVEMIRVYSGIY